MSKVYMVKYEKADPFDLMCSDCPVNYIECFEEMSELELREEHTQMIGEDAAIPDWERERMADQFGWTPTNPDFDKWLEECIAEGHIKVKEDM